LASLSLILFTIAQAPPTSRPAPPRQWWAALFDNPMMVILIGFAFVYIFLIRSKKRQDRQKQEQLNQIKRGDRVQTIGGILGKVVDVEERKVLLKVDESSNTKIWFSRNAVHRVLPTDEEKAETPKQG
jgi:preprotein translocase subunit YajC